MHPREYQQAQPTMGWCVPLKLEEIDEELSHCREAAAL